MPKISTTIKNNETTNEEQAEVSDITEVDKQTKVILKHFNKNKIKAPQKSVDFILGFSKAFRNERLSNGENAEMLIN
jgi:hypothetical protein